MRRRMWPLLARWRRRVGWKEVSSAVVGAASSLAWEAPCRHCACITSNTVSVPHSPCNTHPTPSQTDRPTHKLHSTHTRCPCQRLLITHREGFHIDEEYTVKLALW